MNNSDRSNSHTSPTLLGRLRGDVTDQAAWREFVARYGPRILLWCRRWGLQEADSHDVTQAVLLKMAQHLQRFDYDPTKSFRGWLKTVAHNSLSDFLTAQQRAGRGSGDSSILKQLESIEAKSSLVEQLQTEFDEEILAEAMSRVQLRVSANKWQAFYLTAIEGLSGAQAAARLNMLVATVFTAKSKVQKLIQMEIRKLDQLDGAVV